MMRCEDVRSRSTAFITGILSEQEEAAFREHILHCSECRGEVMRDDPSRLFVALSGQRKPQEFWAGFWEQVESNLPTRNPLVILFQRYEPVLVTMLLICLAISAFFAGRAFMGTESLKVEVFPELSPSEGVQSPDLTLAVMRTLQQRYGISSYLAASNPRAEVVDLTYQDEESNVYHVTMIIDERLEESF